MNYNAAKTYIIDRLDRELAPDLHYHDMRHTLDVLQATIELCEAEGIDNEKEITLLKTAALFHDAGFLVHNFNHEQHGCKIVRAELPRFGYEPEDIEKICRMILATKIPQSPKNKWEEILCDADLDYLGRSDFKLIGDRLFEELKAYEVLETREEWDHMQIRFLEKHRYFTKTNKERREAGKRAALEQLLKTK